MSEVTTTSAPATPAGDTAAQVAANVSTEAQTTEAAPTPAEVKSMKEKFKLQVDGEEIEEELDWNDKDSIRNKLQLAAAAKKRIGEAKTKEHKAMEILKAFEDGTLLSKHPNARKLAEDLLLAQIQEDMLDPKDKEIRDLKAKNEKHEKSEKQKADELTKSANAKKEYAIAQEFQATIIGALNKSGLPKSPKLVQRAADLMSKNLDLGLTLTIDDLVSELKGETTSTMKSIIKDAEAEQLIEMFGPDIIKKLRMYDVKKLQESQGKVFQRGSKQTGEAPRPTADKQYMTQEEWQQEVNRRVAAASK